MIEAFFSLSSPRVYLLGVLLMAARAFWKTRPGRCACCAELVKRYVVVVNEQAYDLRYVLVVMLAALWPLAVAIMIGSRLYSLFCLSTSED